MNTEIYIVLGILAIIFIYFIVTYNTLVKLSNIVKEAFATMDVYFKKRWDLIPNLVSVVKGYAKHETDVLENVVKLRNTAYDKMSLTDKIDANEQIANGLSKLMAIVENYPDLKASQNFSDLHRQLVQLENDIANARKYYNAVVRNMNTKIQMFPSNIVANMFKFETATMFEANANEKDNVKVEL